MTTLSQIVAVRKGAQNETFKAVSTTHREIQKSDLTTGFVKTYTPLDEENGDRLPGEEKRVIVDVTESLLAACASMRRLWDLVATQDAANNDAVADIVIGEEVLAESVPAVTLLFLEKQILEIQALVDAVPVLDPAKKWSYDPSTGMHRSEPVRTNRSVKEPTVIVRYDATDKHPAQTEMYLKDVPVGTWETTSLSAGLPAREKREMRRRVTLLREAVKKARQKANETVVVDQSIAAPLLDYVLGSHQTPA